MFLYILGLGTCWFLYRWFKENKRVSDPSEKYIFITGCDSGFGNLLAKHLDRQGFGVIAGCFTEKGEDSLRKVCSETLTTVRLDVTDTESISHAAAVITTLVGQKGLWALVNNAGVSVPTGPCDWLTVQDYRAVLEVNLLGVVAVTLSVLRLIKLARGRVVNVASVLGRVSAFGGPYGVSKHGVEAFNDSLRLNMAPFGVKVLCIEPGFFKTGMSDFDILLRSLKKTWDGLTQDVKQDYGSDYWERVTVWLNKKLKKSMDDDLMKVVRCMEHAVAAVHPRTRYSPGWDAKLFWIPISYMPTFITDWVFLRDTLPPAPSH